MGEGVFEAVAEADERVVNAGNPEGGDDEDGGDDAEDDEDGPGGGWS